jgi:hypothetical protein
MAAETDPKLVEEIDAIETNGGPFKTTDDPVTEPNGGPFKTTEDPVTPQGGPFKTTDEPVASN